MDGRRGRLIGNAVAPPIAEFIAKQILRIEFANEGERKVEERRAAYAA